MASGLILAQYANTLASPQPISHMVSPGFISRALLISARFWRGVEINGAKPLVIESTSLAVNSSRTITITISTITTMLI